MNEFDSRRLIVAGAEFESLAATTVSTGKSVHSELRAVLTAVYEDAVAAIEDDSIHQRRAELSVLADRVTELGNVKHAARGAFLTLALYKSVFPDQDIRRVKTEHDGGFSARSIDASVTVPFLMKMSLPRNVETHWLTQTFSIATAPWTRDVTLTTVPKAAGPLLIDLVNALEEHDGDRARFARDAVFLLVASMIEVRNKDKVALTRPKGLTIDQTMILIKSQFGARYKHGGPRLPQLAIYAAYQCLFNSGVARYRDWELSPVGRMKAADRKSGTVGDIVATSAGRPIEAVEVKLNIEVGLSIVGEAMEKIKAASVERYLILSTAGMVESESHLVVERIRQFRHSNGCELIVDNVYETLAYLLRLLTGTIEFIDAYATLLETDVDLGYEHRVMWNALCAAESVGTVIEEPVV
jgi:DNA (cytosine-5)-methyltransferase 1